MIETKITVQNKLEILAGNVILVPGCEPISSLTAIALARELAMHCHASVIPVADVLRLIPGSRIVQVMRPRGQPGSGTGLFIELPSGPSHDGNTCPENCVPDWYAILRENASVPQSDDEPKDLGACAGFNYDGCVHDFDPVQHPRDPNSRPNSKPIGGI